MKKFYLLLSMFLAGCMMIKKQNEVIFNPLPLAKDYSFQLPEGVMEVFIPVSQSIRLNALLYKKPGQKNLLIYFQGNAKNLQNWLNNHRMALEWGCNVIVADYRGFGKSGGKLSGEKQMYKDAEMIYEYAMSLGYRPENIILYGYSMGTAMALHVAAVREARKLILESPFSSIAELGWVGSKAPAYPLQNKEKARKVTIPTLILHGEKDTVITPDHAQRVFENIRTSQKQLQIIGGGGHGDLRQKPAVLDMIRNFIDAE